MYVRRLSSVTLQPEQGKTIKLVRPHGDLNEVYVQGSRLLRTFAYRNHIMCSTASPKD